MTLLRHVSPNQIARQVRPPVDAETLSAAQEIVEGVRVGGTPALRGYAERFGERRPDEPLVLGPAAMRVALDGLAPEAVGVLQRTAERVGAFARSQRDAIQEIDVPIPGGRAGHTIEAIQSAGCYAPSGRYPLPSSVLMTAITARVAGCDRVVVASPGAHQVMLAAAAIAGADEFLAVGGAHAVAAMAYGVGGVEPCDVIVGPGNKWVTAAKQIVSCVVGIDMLAGPSELLILADDSANADLVAADLLAQAEHDGDAVPMLVTTSASLAGDVELALHDRLGSLPTAATAREALGNGFVCIAESLDQARELTDRIAAEHLQVMTRDSRAVASTIRHAGAVFIGSATAEVLGDYGAGPNHTLPTGGTARFRAGLSVGHFVRLRSWIRLDDPALARPLIRDAAALAELEGLAAHRRSAEARQS